MELGIYPLIPASEVRLRETRLELFKNEPQEKNNKGKHHHRSVLDWGRREDAGRSSFVMVCVPRAT